MLLLDPADDGGGPDDSLGAEIPAPAEGGRGLADPGPAQRGGLAGEPGELPQLRDPTSPDPREPADWTRSITSDRLRHRGMRRMLRYWWMPPLILVVAVSTFLAGLFLAPLDVTAPAAARPAVLLDLLGRPVAAVNAPTTAQQVPAEAISDVVRSAVVAAVDPGFQSRAGVDPFTLVAAAWHDVAGGGGGHDTITQRYVASALLADGENLPQTRAAALGLRLEQRLSRQEILTRYLNTAYFGDGAYGIQAAALAYFGVPVPSLTLAQAALLGGILVDPERVNPYVDAAAARARQLGTLAKMAALHVISPREAADAGNAPLGLRPAGEPVGVAPDFTDRTAHELRAAYGERALFSSDLRVGTTLDLDLQSAVNAELAGLPQGTGPVAVAAVDPRDGGIRALGHVGDRLAPAPADGLLEPFERAARLSGGDAVSLAELAGLHTGGTEPLAAAQAYATIVAGGRRAPLRDVLAVSVPSGNTGRLLPPPGVGPAAQVLPGPVAEQVRAGLMSAPLPGGAQAAAQQFPLLAGVSPAMFVGCTLSLCLAVQTRGTTASGSAQPGPAPKIFSDVWVGYLKRAGVRALPPALYVPAPVTASPTPGGAVSGGPFTPAHTPDYPAAGSPTGRPPGGTSGLAPIPSSAPVIPVTPRVRVSPPATSSPPRMRRAAHQPAAPAPATPTPSPLVATASPSRSVVSGSPAVSPRAEAPATASGSTGH